MIERPTLRTARLVLRPFVVTDAPAVQHLAGSAEIAATTLSLPHPYLDGMAEAWIASHRPSWEARTKVTYEDVIEYAILRRDSQAGRDVGPA